MTHIKVSKGLDIPIKGKPGDLGRAPNLKSEASPLPAPTLISLNLASFDDIKFRLLVKQDDVVQLGQPLAEDKSSPGRFFVSPAAGVVKEIRRGLKRVLLDIIISVAPQETVQKFTPLDSSAAPEAIIERLKTGGAFAHIRSRPFNLLANPEKKPQNIFVKAIETAPFVPPAELQVHGHEKAFQAGLTALSQLTEGSVHLVYHKNSSAKAFTDAQNVKKHTAEGPHPAGNSSLHIQEIAPIKSAEDNVWTLGVHDVIIVGYLLLEGRYHPEKVISIAGPGILPNKVGYFKAREGFPIAALVVGRVEKGLLRLISGDPLMGHKVTVDDFLGFGDQVFCVIPENTTREFLHFMGIGASKYTFSGAYLTGHFNNKEAEYDFTTNQHGEHRAFIDSTLYEKVNPLDVPTMLLVKAIMAEDFDLAESYGLLEVVPEDFALPTFVCPSKMEMTEIVKKGLKQFAKESLQ